MDKLLELIDDVLGTSGKSGVASALKDVESEEERISKIGDHLRSQISAKVENAKRAGRDEGHGRGKRESLTQIEQDFAKKFGLENPEGDVISMAENLLEKERKEIKLNPEDVKKSEVYVNAMKENRKAIDELKTKLTEAEQARETDQLKTTVNSQVETILKEQNFQLPEDEQRRKHLLSRLQDDILKANGHSLKIEDGNILILDENGKRAMDKEYREINFPDFVQNTAALYFDKGQNDGRTGPGNGKKDGTDGSGKGQKQYNFQPVKDDEEFFTRYHQMDDIEQKKAFVEFRNSQREND